MVWAFSSFLDGLVVFLPSVAVFRLSLLASHILLCQIPSLCRHCISSLPVLGFPILFHFWKQFHVIHVYGWFFLLFMKFAFPYAFLNCCQFLSSVLRGFLDKLYPFVRYLVHFETVCNPILWNQIVCLFAVNPRHIYLFSFCFALLQDVYQCIVALLFLLFPCGILSVLQGAVHGLWANIKCPSWFVPLVFFTS